MTATRTRPARIVVRRRNGLGLTDARLAEYVADRTIVRHRLADGTLVRAEIIGRSPMVRSYVHARIVDGELAGRTVTLGNRIAVEVAE
jgi:hypothetical protein